MSRLFVALTICIALFLASSTQSASAATILLSEYWGTAFGGENANGSEGIGNPINLVDSALNVGATTLAQGGSPPTFNFNTMPGGDRTTGGTPNGAYVARDQKWDSATATNLLLDFDNDRSFADETPQIGFGMHASSFITFDLDAIDADPYGPRTLQGDVGVPNRTDEGSLTSAAILLDGVLLDVFDFDGSVATYDQFASFSLTIPSSGRYLTFVGLSGLDGNNFAAHIGFANVVLSTAEVPEPNTGMFLGFGMLAFTSLRRQRQEAGAAGTRNCQSMRTAVYGHSLLCRTMAMFPRRIMLMAIVVATTTIALSSSAQALTVINLNEYWGTAFGGENANGSEGIGNPINLVSTGNTSGATTLAQGGSPPTYNFNTMPGGDRLNSSTPGGDYVARDRKFDSATATALLLDFDNDGDFTDETPQIGFGMHANAFITFDLSVINPDRLNATLTGQVGVSNVVANQVGAGPTSAAILLDGSLLGVYDFVNASGSYDQFDTFNLAIPTSGQYLTFIGLAGLDTANGYAHIGFANVALNVATIPEPGTCMLVALGLLSVTGRRRRPIA